MSRYIITIDGLSGTGKSARASDLARSLDWDWLGIGYLYRAFAFLKITSGNLDKVAELVLDPGGGKEGREPRVILGDRDITNLLHSNPEIERVCSIIARKEHVRDLVQAIVTRQTRNGNWVIEGRSANRIFPDAQLGFFLTSTREERVKRTIAGAKCRGKGTLETDQVSDHIDFRDAVDLGREFDPLRVRKSSVVIDSTHYAPERTTEIMMMYVRDRIYSVPWTISVVFGPPVDGRKLLTNLCTLFQQELKGARYEILLPDSVPVGLVGKCQELVPDVDVRAIRMNSSKWLDMEISVAKQIQGDVCVFLDSQLQVKAGFLDHHLRFHTMSNNLLVAGCFEPLNPNSSSWTTWTPIALAFCAPATLRLLGSEQPAWPLANISMTKHTLVNLLEETNRTRSVDRDSSIVELSQFVHLCYNPAAGVCFQDESSTLSNLSVWRDGLDAISSGASNGYQSDVDNDTSNGREVLIVEVGEATDRAVETLQDLAYRRQLFDHRTVILSEQSPSQPWGVIAQVVLRSLDLDYWPYHIRRQAYQRLIRACHSRGLKLSRVSLEELPGREM